VEEGEVAMTRDEFLTEAMRKPGESGLDFITPLLWSQDDARHYVPQGGPEKWTWEDFCGWASDKWWHAAGVGIDGSVFEIHAKYTRWLFNPERFAGILAEFLGWREGK